MPQVKGLRLPKIKAQPPVTNTVTPLAGGSRRWTRSDRANSKAPTLDTRVWTFTPSKPKLSEWDEAILRGYRQDLARCKANACACVCFCHSGNECDIELGLNPRIHTPGHRPVSVVVVDPITGTRSRKEIVCHDTPDSILETPYHFRKA